MSDPEPHDCPKDCHPLRASDGVSPACSDTCQRPLGHGPPWCLIEIDPELRVFYDTAIMMPGLS